MLMMRVMIGLLSGYQMLLLVHLLVHCITTETITDDDAEPTVSIAANCLL